MLPQKNKTKQNKKDSLRDLKWSCSVVSTLCDPMDCSLPGSSVHGIFQARILEWIAISFSRGSSQPRDRTRVFPQCRQMLLPSELPGKPTESAKKKKKERKKSSNYKYGSYQKGNRDKMGQETYSKIIVYKKFSISCNTDPGNTGHHMREIWSYSYWQKLQINCQ